MPIAFAPVGENVTIRKVSGDEKVRKHLESLGIVPNRTIKILEQTRGGVVVLVSDMRLALDQNVAMNIMVD